MAGFDNGVSSPGGMSYAAPLMNFAQFGNWAADDPYKKVFDQQQQQLNEQRIAQGQRQTDIAQTFKGGLPVDPATGAIDYKKAVAMLAQKGDTTALWNGADAMLSQSATNQSPLLTGGAQPAQGAPVPARPSAVAPANSPQGDAGQGTVASLVTDRLPNQDATTGQTIAKIAQTMGVDPNATLSAGQLRRAQGLLQKYAPADSGAPAGGEGTGNLPPSANAVSAAPRVTRQPAPAVAQPGAQGAATAQGAPQPQPQPQPPQPQQPAPIGAGAPQPAAPQPQPQPQPNTPITPQVPLPKGFNDPQQAILALRAEAARLSSNPRAKGQADQLTNWAERIEASIKPVETHAGTTFRDPRSGQVLFREPTASQSRQAAPEMIDKIADGISSGSQPPSLSGLYSNSAPVRAALQERGFDLSKAQLEFERAKKQISSLNGPQMTRFVGLAHSVDRTIDEVRGLSEEMQNSGIPFFNRKKIEGYMQLEGNSEKGQLAARYIGAVNTLKEEFANLAQGGYAPTEAVWELANKQINGDYGFKQMSASLDEIQRLIRYRVQAIPGLDTMGPGAANRYTGQAGAQPTAGASSSKPKGTTSGGLNWSVE